MITYRQSEIRPGVFVNTPILHKVKFDSKPYSNCQEVYDWCQKTCIGRFYIGPSWAGTFVEFEDPDDIPFFILRWG